MLILTDIKPSFYVYDTYSCFANLTLGDVRPYFKIVENLGYRLYDKDLPLDTPVKCIPMNGEFGMTTLDNLAKGYVNCILAAYYIAHNKKICFLAGEFGKNAVELLCKIANNTYNVYLYDSDCTLPCTGITKELRPYIKRVKRK